MAIPFNVIRLRGTMTAPLSIFNFITLNGYIAASNGDTSWHTPGPEEAEYSEQSASPDSLMLFGRVTYGHMRAFWPTPRAAELMPRTAHAMNAAEKIVFSRTMGDPGWENVRVVSADPADEVRRLKEAQTKPMVVLGSGTIVTQLAAHGLIDEYKLMVDPVALGDGKAFLEGMTQRIKLRLKSSRVFQSGALMLIYEPA
jgi:dihydrofolate reductase